MKAITTRYHGPIMTDEGTHGGPDTVRVTCEGTEYVTRYYHGGGLISEERSATCPKASALRTRGRIRVMIRG